MGALRLLLKGLGWLLTPLVASAASFLGAEFGTLLSEWVPSPIAGLLLTIACGAATGFIGTHFWIRFLQTHRRLSRALQIDPVVLAAIQEEGPAAGAEP
ncbi:MAG: hypothetical protein ACHQXA_06920 [Gemmatimonadales bacterium]